MAKFEPQQAADVLAIHQLVNEWATELDINNGLSITGLLTEDCDYTVRGGPRHGRDAVLAFYRERHAELSATAAGVPIHRHAVINPRVTFDGTDAARIDFGMIYWTAMGMASGTDHADPALVADVSMACRRCADGHWRIARFDSAPVFRRVAG
ncbi:MAG: nuclear transport factor 2 family protein [Novosphingobium sp.]